MTLEVVSGVDVVDVERFRRAVERTPRLVGRVFTEREQGASRGRLASLAGRFAAKEATLKALRVGLGHVALRELEVLADDAGAPSLVLGPAASRLAQARGWLSVSCSISHERTVAVAVVVALRR